MSDERKLLCSYDEVEIARRHVKLWMDDDRDLDEDEAFEMAWRDCDLWDRAREDVKESLTCVLNDWELLDKPLRIDGFRIGWQNLEGMMFVHPESGADFLEKVLPDTHCYWWVWESNLPGIPIYMQVSHHDSPTGEMYYIRDISDQWCPGCERLHDDTGHLAAIAEHGECLNCYWLSGHYCAWCRSDVNATLIEGDGEFTCSLECESKLNAWDADVEQMKARTVTELGTKHGRNMAQACVIVRDNPHLTWLPYEKNIEQKAVEINTHWDYLVAKYCKGEFDG